MATIAPTTANKLVNEHVSEQRPTTEPAAATTPLSAWNKIQVRDWFRVLNLNILAGACYEANIDGALLIELDTEAWKELGVTSAIERARMIASVKKKSREIVATR